MKKIWNFELRSQNGKYLINKLYDDTANDL